MDETDRQRVALVTGGAVRVGRAIVERLCAGGFAAAFTYRSNGVAAAELAERTGALGIEADLTQPVQACPHIAQAVLRRFGRLDVLVNSASIYEPADGDEATEIAQLRRMMSIHVEAPLLLCRRLGAALRSSHGHVVNLVDLLAEQPTPRFLGYSASKAALVNLTLGLARELAPQVTVNGIAPGMVDWPVGYPEDQREKYLKRVPLGRAGTPGDVAELVWFLVNGGSYVTGQILRLDGGRSIT
jgi:pteridine reductase